MPSQKTSLTDHPFQQIKTLLKEKAISLPVQPEREESRSAELKCTPEDEESLFSKAMEGVRLLSRDNYAERVFHVVVPEGLVPNEDAETLSKLQDLIKNGAGFNVFDTPEYIEGTGYNVHPEIARRLHRGDYSIQAHIDLHGFIVQDAQEAFEKFLKWAVTTGKTGLLIIHGRGLSSPSEPVLKKKVVEWLTRGPWRKWVMAYASARRCDGGAGATYVLLRTRAVSKRMKRRKTMK